MSIDYDTGLTVPPACGIQQKAMPLHKTHRQHNSNIC